MRIVSLGWLVGGDGAVEAPAVVEARIDVVQEVGGGDRRAGAINRDLDIAMLGFEQHHDDILRLHDPLLVVSRTSARWEYTAVRSEGGITRAIRRSMGVANVLR